MYVVNLYIILVLKFYLKMAEKNSIRLTFIHTHCRYFKTYTRCF